MVVLGGEVLSYKRGIPVHIAPDEVGEGGGGHQPTRLDQIDQPRISDPP